MQRLLTFVMCGIMLTATAFPSAADAPKGDFYISPAGSDSNAGTMEKPFASLERAREAVREKVARGLKGNVLVLIRAGVYRLENALEFYPGDGGTEKRSVTYAAYPDEKVVVSGGRPITGWKAGGDDMWTMYLPMVKHRQLRFRQLYADGQRLPRGRFPEEGFLKIKKHSDDFKQLEFTTALPEGDLGGRDIEVVVVENWSIAREIIDANTQNSLTAHTPIGWIGHGWCRPKPGQSVFLEHALEFVKKPGQWYLDRHKGILHYKAAKGEDPNKREFIVPVLEQLVHVKGTRQQPVRNLHFRGVEFAYAAWRMPEIGYAGLQAAYNGTIQDESVPTFSSPVAIEFTQARNCSLADSKIIHVGASAVGLGAGCQNSKVMGCEISDVGANGPMVGYMPVKTPLWADWGNPLDVPKSNEISNNYIHHCGVEMWGAVGIFDAMTENTRIVHNELAHLPYGGISIGYVWNTKTTSQKNCLVAYNHVYEVLERLYDSGAIYTLGYQPGTVIRGNHLHGVRRSGYAFGQPGNNGIFLDHGSKGFHLEGNAIYDIAQKPIRYNQSEEGWHTWKNNTFHIAPSQLGFPKELLTKAGIQSPYKERLGR